MRQKLGAKAQIPTAKAYDVLGQIKEFTVTIETVKDGVLASGSAKETLDYTLSEAGTYLVTYYAKDSNGNFEKIPYAIRVSDETAPTLTVKDSFKSSYKLNAKISVPSYKVSDNNENCYVQVTVTLPNNEVRLLQYAENGELLYVLSREAELYEKAFIADEDTFVALYAGKYVLRVVAYDDYYNYTAEDVLLMGDTVITKNVKMSKVAQLEQELGQKPVLVFGNSTGDVPMAVYADTDNQYATEVFFVLCDDVERENGNISKAEKVASICAENGWQTISMQNDWATIYGENVTLASK
jgi:hypothetical protein